MRIIAGEFRGRRLLPPEGDVTRPITDRVKQSLFDILAPRLEGAVVWDLFAGTGNMGLESLSRGARKAVFYESDRGAVARLRKNITALGLPAGRAVVQSTDLFKWFRPRGPREGSAAASPDPADSADIVFLDPPYRFLTDRPDDLRRLGRQLAERHLAPAGLVVFRHDARDGLELPPLTRYDSRTYGGMTLEFLDKDSAPPLNPARLSSRLD
jgi:16S rRNA (guanine(966)-N(2))-methyltransferase RsmD